MFDIGLNRESVTAVSNWRPIEIRESYSHNYHLSCSQSEGYVLLAPPAPPPLPHPHSSPPLRPPDSLLTHLDDAEGERNASLDVVVNRDDSRLSDGMVLQDRLKPQLNSPPVWEGGGGREGGGEGRGGEEGCRRESGRRPPQ